MTTIAYRDGMLASDSRCCTGTVITDEYVPKLFPLADGSCVGIVGQLEDAMKFVDWMAACTRGEDVGEQPTLEHDAVDLIHLRADGTLWMTSNGHWFRCYGKYHAWGSGKVAALACLAAGLDPVAAVKAASKVDPFSGGRTQTFSLAAE